jgi:hemerythrin-like domain-containing protein
METEHNDNGTKKRLKLYDPVEQQQERGFEQEAGASPMDPPDAYAPPALDPVPLEQMHPFLQKLGTEHVSFSEELKKAEDAIHSVKEHGFTEEVYRSLIHFLGVLDQDFVPHSRREEMELFPLLAERMLASGEHSRGSDPTTAVDLMLDEHLKANRSAAVVLHFIEMASRLPDEKSRLILVGAALREALNLVELLRLHIFREDNVVFASAHRLVSKAELDRMTSATDVAPPDSHQHHSHQHQ